MRYFKTQSPLSKVFLSGGRVVKWFTSDGVVGWFATDDPIVVQSLLDFSAKKIGGGIEEVEQAEYDVNAEGKARGRRYEPDREWVGSEGANLVPSANAPLSAPPVAEGSPAPLIEPSSPPTPKVRRRATNTR